MNVLGLYSKRPEYFCSGFPIYQKKAKGCEITDISNKKYIDMSHIGFSACVLGYSNPIINAMAKKAINDGSFSLLNSFNDKINADNFIKIHKWADKVRFTRSGGEACQVAAEIAKANTNRKGILQCGYSGWKLQNENHRKFTYNDIESFYQVINKNIGIVIVEAIRYEEPSPEWIELLKEINKKYILIIDEITSGFRFANGGIHEKWGLRPAMAVFGKSMSNGFPCGAVLMRGDIEEGNKFISSTYWTDNVTPAAITMSMMLHRIYRPHYLAKIGKEIKKVIVGCADYYQLPIKINEVDHIIKFTFDHEKTNILETLYTQLMLKEKFLATNIIYPSYAHKIKHLKEFARAIYKVFFIIKKHINDPERILIGNEKKHKIT